jgi:hypothetical protein
VFSGDFETHVTIATDDKNVAELVSRVKAGAAPWTHADAEVERTAVMQTR